LEGKAGPAPSAHLRGTAPPGGAATRFAPAPLRYITPGPGAPRR